MIIKCDFAVALALHDQVSHQGAIDAAIAAVYDQIMLNQKSYLPPPRVDDVPPTGHA